MLIEWEREWWFEINVYPAYGYNYDRSSLSATNIHLQMIKSRQSSFKEYWEGLEYDYDESMNCRVQLSSSDTRHCPESCDQVIVQHHLLMITPVKHSVTQPDNRHVVIITAVFLLLNYTHTELSSEYQCFSAVWPLDNKWQDCLNFNEILNFLRQWDWARRAASLGLLPLLVNELESGCKDFS